MDGQASMNTSLPPVWHNKVFSTQGPQTGYRAFSVDVRLRDWDEGNYPADAHRECSPNCPFVTNSSSVSSSPSDPSSEVPYIGSAVDKVLAGESETNQADATPVSGNSLSEDDLKHNSHAYVRGNTASESAANNQPDSCQVKWSSPKIQAVLEMGCERDLVQRVTTEHFRNTGKEFPSATLLYEAIQDYVIRLSV